MKTLIRIGLVAASFDRDKTNLLPHTWDNPTVAGGTLSGIALLNGQIIISPNSAGFQSINQSEYDLLHTELGAMAIACTLWTRVKDEGNPIWYDEGNPIRLDAIIAEKRSKKRDTGIVLTYGNEQAEDCTIAACIINDKTDRITLLGRVNGVDIEFGQFTPIQLQDKVQEARIAIQAFNQRQASEIEVFRDMCNQNYQERIQRDILENRIDLLEPQKRHDWILKQVWTYRPSLSELQAEIARRAESSKPDGNTATKKRGK